MNDCMRRLELHRNIGSSAEQIEFFEAEAADLRSLLGSNEYFATLPAPVQKQCMNGKFLMMASRDEMLARFGYQKAAFDAIWDLWSQHVHILPLSFLRMEPNGRGTGIENQADRDYWTHALLMSAAAMCSATNELVNIFPDVADSRLGVRSEFSPSPHANRLRPNRKKEGLAARAPVDSGQAILSAVEKLLELFDGETQSADFGQSGYKESRMKIKDKPGCISVDEIEAVGSEIVTPASAAAAGNYCGYDIFLAPNRDQHRGGFEWSIHKDGEEIGSGLDFDEGVARESARIAIDKLGRGDAPSADYVRFKSAHSDCIKSLASELGSLSDSTHWELIDEMKGALGSSAANAAAGNEADQEEGLSSAEAWVAENCSNGGVEEDVAMALWLRGMAEGESFLRSEKVAPDRSAPRS